MNLLRLFLVELGSNIQIFSCLRRYFFRLRRPTCFTLMDPQQNFRVRQSCSSPQLNAGGCSNGICTTLPSRERYCVRTPEATVKGKRLACHPLLFNYLKLRIPWGFQIQKIAKRQLVLGPKLVPKTARRRRAKKIPSQFQVPYGKSCFQVPIGT